MAVQLAPTPMHLELLFQPDELTEEQRAVIGWRRKRADQKMERRHSDDLHGARIQYAIACYALCGPSRREIASFLGVTENTLAYYLRGEYWGIYGQPVLRALRRLGVPSGKGRRSHRADRLRDIQAASQRVMGRALDALEGPPLGIEADARDELISDLRLLSITEDDLS